MNVMDDNQRKLAEDNMNLVHHIIAREYPTFRGDEDIIQCATLGLCKATMKWDEARGKFSTYACSCIRRAIAQELRARQPHREVISLDCPITEDLTLGDVVAGEDDMGFIDYGFLKDLTNDEKRVFKLKIQGYSIEDIQKLTGYDLWKIRKIIRIIRVKYKRTH